MELTQEDFQKAKRISREIQAHLESTNSNGLRSTDIYPILARKNLIEKDKENGVHLRKFLRYLYKMGALESLIPQCKPQKSKSSNILMEWYFYKVHSEIQLPPVETIEEEEREIKMPTLTDSEIDELIELTKPHIEKLPQRDTDEFTYSQLETRKLYARAYESWSSREIEILTRAYHKFEKIDKVAELLERQPSAVRLKLQSLKIQISGPFYSQFYPRTDRQ